MSKMVGSLLSTLLSDTDLMHSSSAPTKDAKDSLPYQPFQSPSIPLLSSSSPSHHSIEEDAGNHRLVKHPEELAADIEGPQPPQEVQPALPFLVECLSVG